jgi:hypothetical protein
MPDEAALREKAWEAIRSGKLPSRRADRTYGGPGSGKLCSLCSEPVTLDQVEMEMEFKRHGSHPGFDRYFLHIRCFVAWEFQRAKIGAAG